ncbi:hypothetical protein QNA08_03570 [Chelatococcus sp. SYSU_G07232]|uniref:Uncharacterized protein n=1 Tax=Chelatococcus albus TaxID=3047466 RepID=A0ABT7AFB2_9HYPH|nr:hypothetical protein [Chelatococcus sp. SYSU_G07232]MDJ1157316.1 hypothetical protein [Chelatococcus sp. SYSU_G07232]
MRTGSLAWAGTGLAAAIVAVAGLDLVSAPPAAAQGVGIPVMSGGHASGPGANRGGLLAVTPARWQGPVVHLPRRLFRGAPWWWDSGPFVSTVEIAREPAPVPSEPPSLPSAAGIRAAPVAAPMLYVIEGVGKAVGRASEAPRSIEARRPPQGGEPDPTLLRIVTVRVR